MLKFCLLHYRTNQKDISPNCWIALSALQGSSSVIWTLLRWFIALLSACSEIPELAASEITAMFWKLPNTFEIIATVWKLPNTFAIIAIVWKLPNPLMRFQVNYREALKLSLLGLILIHIWEVLKIHSYNQFFISSFEHCPSAWRLYGSFKTFLSI